MRKESSRILFIEMILFLISVGVFFFSKHFTILGYSFLLGIVLTFATLLLGISKREENQWKDVFLIILIYTTSYYLLTYFFGYFTGFFRSTYSHTFSGVCFNLLSWFFYGLVVEILRWIILKRCKYQSRVFVVLLVIILSFVEMVTKSTFYALNSKMDIINLLISFLPILSKNILLSYIVTHNSILNSITYRLMMELPIYILPIFPNFGDYLNSILLVGFPLLLLQRIQKELFGEKRKIENSRVVSYDRFQKIGMIFVSCIVLLMVFLVSGLFPFYALTIGSNSMKNTISMGDVVILNKNSGTFQENDIIAYRHDGKIIVHRIVEVNDFFYRTKGDNNDEIDLWKVHEEDIVGKVTFKIRFLGWPTVMLNQWIMDGE